MKNKSKIQILVGAIILLPLIILITIFYADKIATERERVEFETNTENFIDVIKNEVEVLQFDTVKIIQGIGNATIDSVNIEAPFRIKYAYESRDESSLKMYTEKDGVLDGVPRLVCSGSGADVSMQYASLDSVKIKLETNGAWVMVFESFDYTSFPSKDTRATMDSLSAIKRIDSVRIVNAIDSLITCRAKHLFKVDKYNFSSLQSKAANLMECSKIWHAIISKDGGGDFESMNFYLPACKVRVNAGFCPSSGKSVVGCISLEGQGKKQSWDILPSCMYMTNSWITKTRTVTVPAGYYWIDVASNGYWAFEVSALY